jgi:hypothetical protein
MTIKSSIKAIVILTMGAVVCLAISALPSFAEVIFVVDAPNDGFPFEGARPTDPTWDTNGDAIDWPDTVIETFDESTAGDSSTGLSGSLHISGTGWWEDAYLGSYYHGNYVGDLRQTDTATWTAMGFTPGQTVEVYANWHTQFNYDSNAPYVINGGAPVFKNLNDDLGGTNPASDLVLNDGTRKVNFELLDTVMADPNGQIQVVASSGVTTEDEWIPIDAMVFRIPTELTLDVNRTTGEVTLNGDPSYGVGMNFYQISSAGNSLDPTGWNSLDEQNFISGDFDGDGTVNGADFLKWQTDSGTSPELAVWEANYGNAVNTDPGESWEEWGGFGTHGVAEAFLLGDSTIAAGSSMSLGTAFDVGGAEDWVFTYRTNAVQKVTTSVNFYTPLAAASTVPEPSSLALLVLGLVGLGSRITKQV